ncbi:putative choriogenin hminor [Golovinomyces cichoracearum]|uniref:Putative choriogenin hminor n=1 Tax=Golovinomyces cichoracearum TaxID=62708 RepID=A0A420IUL4_9PEZI|nr:putative choriogenin hminor [Golovinomyces cichoracearum]
MTSKKSSRLRRISRFLPRLNTEPSLSEVQIPPLPSKRLPPHTCDIASPRHPSPSICLEDSPNLSLDQGDRLRRHAISSPSASSFTSSEEKTISRNSTLLRRVAIGGMEYQSMPNLLGLPKSRHSDVYRENTSGKLRKSWLPGSRARSARFNTSDSTNKLPAWVNAGGAKIEYNLTPLLQGEKVLELWNETAETFVHLWPQESGRLAQMRVPYSVIESSMRLRNLIRDSQCLLERKKEQTNLANKDTIKNVDSDTIGTPPYTPEQSLSGSNSISGLDEDPLDGPRQYYLYFPVNLDIFGSPLSSKDIQKLVDVRNLFALLTSQPLVATPLCPTNFKIFLSIAVLLKEYYSNESENSYGNAVDLAFSFCLKEIPQLADCRESREVTIEALVLAEAMKSAELFSEAFAHAVGKYDALESLKSGSVFNLISPLTRNRLEKASRDLKQRIRSVNDRLCDFEFPSLFAGIAASTSLAESKLVRFKQWKLSFAALRKQVISYYKERHGQWPPKASSKKNNFVEGGLNRLVLKGLYSDLCDLYDFLADRESLTTRVYNEDGVDEPIGVTPVARALRKLLDEYDRSSPPVQPPIPYDIPLIPLLRNIDPDFQGLGPTDQHKRLNQRLSEKEISLILAKSHNVNSDYKTPFIEMFKTFELKEGKGKSAFELSEQRYGHWIFMYACLQALPLLVTDAPGLQYTDGVEYFLCQVPLGNLPWIEDQSLVKMSWFEVQGGQQIVSLPCDIVNHGVEATYSRSHCWVVAQEWMEAGSNSVTSESPLREEFSPLSPPPFFDRGGFGIRGGVGSKSRNSDNASICSSHTSGSNKSQHRSRNHSYYRGSIGLGLERVRIDTDEYTINRPTSRGTSLDSLNYSLQSRPPSRAESRRDLSREFGSSTFDDILGSMSADKKKVEGKWTKKTRRKNDEIKNK